MKESTKKYIIKKIQKLDENIRVLSDGKTYTDIIYGTTDSLFLSLEKAVSRLSEKNGYSFDSFFEIGGQESSLEDSLPMNISDLGKEGEEAVYVHMLNSDIQDIVGAIGNVKDINGEICVSNIGDDQFSIRNTKIGLLFHGKPSKTFECDCWSYTKADGTRYATRLESYSNRNESWLVPAKSKLMAVVYNDKSYPMALKAADTYGLDLVPFSAVNG